MLPAELFANIIEIINSTITNTCKLYECILELDGEISFNEEYERIVYRQRVIIEKCTPLKVFYKYFRQLLDRVVEKFYEKNKEPCAIGITIFSESNHWSIDLFKSNLNDFILDDVFEELIEELTDFLLVRLGLKKNKDTKYFYGGPLEITIWIL